MGYFVFAAWLLPALASPAPEAEPHAGSGGTPVASVEGTPDPGAGEAPSGVLTLAEALGRAREHHPLLRQARAATRAARARVDQATAPLFPEVSADAGYGRATANAPPGGSRWDTFNRFDFGLRLDQVIYDFGRTSRRIDAADARAEAEADDARATLLAIERDVRVSYFDASAARALLEVARETLAVNERHVREIEAFVAAGARAEIDLAQARTDRANARVDLVTAENAYAAAKARLGQAIGTAAGSAWEVGDEAMDAIAGEDGALDALVVQALRMRPELAGLERHRRAQEFTLRAIRGDYFPTLGASASASEGGQELDDMRWNLGIGVSLRWVLFAGGITSAQADEASAELARLEAETDAVVQRIRFEVEEARLGVRAAKAVREAAEEAVHNARERLRLAEGRYQTGVGSALELGDAQVDLSSALAQRVKAENSLASARARLLAALGKSG
jgi:outer membrane protein